MTRAQIISRPSRWDMAVAFFHKPYGTEHSQWLELILSFKEESLIIERLSSRVVMTIIKSFERLVDDNYRMKGVMILNGNSVEYTGEYNFTTETGFVEFE